MTFPSPQIIEDACRIVYEAMQPTAQYRWPLLCQRAGCEVWLKHENHGPLGAFKIRSALVYFRRLREAGGAARVAVTATRGNFGQAVAFAARREGMEAVVYVPHGKSPGKNRAMQSLGDRKSTRLNSSHLGISYAVFCLKNKQRIPPSHRQPPRRHPAQLTLSRHICL